MQLRAVFLFLLTLAYPGLVYLGYRSFQPSALALLLAGLALLRALSSKEKIWRVTAAVALTLALASIAANQILPLKLYPALVSGALLVIFALSLRYPPTVIERIAQLQDGPLTQEGIHYTRRVTQVWCGFFVINGSLAIATALWCSNEIWALYNGLLAYGLMGLLFGVEWLVRMRMKSRLR
jgi:uncharacterized membrane protein